MPPHEAEYRILGGHRQPMIDNLIAPDLLQLLHAVLLIVGALLPVVNPPGNVPIFLNLTDGCDEATRRDLARHIAIYSFALLLGSMLLGSLVLRLFDLSVAALQVAGGAVVCALGWNLLHYEPRTEGLPDPEQARQVALGRAFYPLTLPVSVDAGVIAVAITLGAHHGQTVTVTVIQIMAALIGSALIAASLLLVYRYAGRVSRWIGTKGMEVMLRLSALLVLSIGVQIVWNGLKSLIAEIHIA
jgi:multiple antibiotic resistance protein